MAWKPPPSVASHLGGHPVRIELEPQDPLDSADGLKILGSERNFWTLPSQNPSGTVVQQAEQPIFDSWDAFSWWLTPTYDIMESTIFVG